MERYVRERIGIERSLLEWQYRSGPEWILMERIGMQVSGKAVGEATGPDGTGAHWIGKNMARIGLAVLD